MISLTSLTALGLPPAPGTGGVVTPETDFVFTMTTTGASEDVTIPCQNVGTFDATIDWGDESTSTITAYNDPDLTHTYAEAGDHEIRISGTFPNIYFNNSGHRLKLKSVSNLGEVGWQELTNAFYGCSNLTEFVSGNTDTSSVANMISAFRDCSGLTTLDLSTFDTSSVANMVGTFRNCSSLTTLDLSSFDTSVVTNMGSMFNDCSALISLDVSAFDTSAVETMSSMFRNCSNLLAIDVSSFDTSLVDNMSSMFLNCDSLTDIVGLENFVIEALDDTGDLNNFAVGVTLPTARYDAVLNAWDAQDPFNGMAPNFGSSQYSAAGSSARASLISNDGWTITDGGPE